MFWKVGLLKRKSLAVILSFALLVTSAVSIIGPIVADPVEYWALIVCGSYSGIEPSFGADAAFMYHTLSRHYTFNGIYYLHAEPSIAPEANGIATKENIRWAIKNWLDQRSDSNDIIFVYYTDHGAGYNTYYKQVRGLDDPAKAIDGKRGDPVDEGNEVWNATAGKWVGYDEALTLQRGTDTTYWDDEIKADLNYLASRGRYGKLVFVCFACYSGGLIDDLSAPNRIIMTSANETTTSPKFGPGSWFNSWSERFIEALHREKVTWDYNKTCLIHTGVSVNADWSNDGNISMWEAWDYAWKNDYWRQQGKETPWLDDNGDSLPNYKEGRDMSDSRNGLFCMETYFGSGNLKSADINEDGIVDIIDVTIVAVAQGSYPGHLKWNSLADLNNDQVVDIIDVTFVGIHVGKWYPKQ